MAFPINPTNGQQATVNGVSYFYSTALRAWTVNTNTGTNITANNGSITNQLTVGGNITAAGITTTSLTTTGGTITANNGSITNQLTVGGNITAAGITASSLTTSGAISATTANITNQLTVSSTLTAAGINATSLSLAIPLAVGQGGTGTTTSTGTGSVVRSIGPTFTGIPLAPTAAANTATTQIATTEFVATAVAAGTTGGLGVGQTWQNVSSSRAYGTTYTNTTSKPISVYSDAFELSEEDEVYFMTGYVGSVKVATSATGGWSGGTNGTGITFIVPPGATYRITVSGADQDEDKYWAELR